MKKVFFIGVLASMIFNSCVKEEENETVNFQKSLAVDENNADDFQYTDLNIDVKTSGGNDCLGLGETTFNIDGDSLDDFEIEKVALKKTEGCSTSFPEYIISSDNGFELLQDTISTTDSKVTITHRIARILKPGDEINTYYGDELWASSVPCYNTNILFILKNTSWQKFTEPQYVAFRQKKENDYKYGWLKIENKDAGLVITKAAYQK